MAINEEARRKEFKNCTSFDELGRLCDKYWYVFEHFADEVRNKMYSLPIEFNESFIHFLLRSYHLDNDLTADNLRATYVSLLRDYSNRVVNEGLLKEPLIQSEYIPMIVYSATDHGKIHTIYLAQAFDGYASEEDINKLFVQHEYHLKSELLNADTDYVKYCHAVDILTSQAAYEDYIFQFTAKIENDHGTRYLELRSQHLWDKYITPYKSSIDISKIELMDIYYFLTYIITSIEENMDYLVSSQKFIFEKGIRSVYDSIDMMLLNIPIYPNPELAHGRVASKIYNQYRDIKKSLSMEIINEAFLYLYRYKDQLNKTVDIKKYFKIEVDLEKNEVVLVRVIPDNPTMIYDKNPSPIAMEAYDKNSSKMDKASRKIYSGYKAYKDAENKVDSQITKLITRIKGVFTGKQSARDKIIEGEEISAIKIIKKIMTTAAIFSYSKIAGVLYVITKHYCSKAVTNRERKRLVEEIELEIKMLDEKIEDARGDGNRQAKYSMMRTRAELQKALEQIKYGLTASEKAMNTAKAVLNGKKNLDYTGPNRSEEE